MGRTSPASAGSGYVSPWHAMRYDPVRAGCGGRTRPAARPERSGTLVSASWNLDPPSVASRRGRREHGSDAVHLGLHRPVRWGRQGGAAT
jgi:hypothetical protein